MNRNVEALESPLNANERYLYAIAVRQDIIIEQLSSIIDYISKKEDIAVFDEIYSEVSDVIEGQISIDEIKQSSLEDLTKQELVEILVNSGVTFNKRQNKNELIELVKEIM